MASSSFLASLQSVCCSQHVAKKPESPATPNRSMEAKQAARIRAPKLISIESQAAEQVEGAASSTAPCFADWRWKNGTWDLNSFVKDGKMDWDAVIVAEARRRKLRQMYPQPSTNEAPVPFRSSIIPWWLWIRRFHLPQAEILNGRAAMLGFFAAYLVDGLSGVGVVDQTGNSICQACLLAVVGGVILFRQTEDLGKLRSLTEEAILYEQQWRATYEETASEERAASKED